MENKLARFFKTTGMLRFLLPFGLILMALGIYLLATQPKEYGETVGTITGTEQYTELDSDNLSHTYYRVFFRYTVDGRQYENSFDGYSDQPETGKTLTVFYDTAHPDSVSNTRNTGLIAIIILAVGAACIALGIFTTVKAVRKNRELDQKLKEAAGTDTIPEVVPLPKDQLTEYYVSFDGNSLKPGYLVEDSFRRQVFAAPMTKNSLVANRIFTFTDYRTGRSEEHQVGHTVSQSFSNEVLSTSSYFKFDGRNIWDVLHDRGIRISTDLVSRFPRTVYTVSLNGRFFATIETSSKYVHEEDEAAHSVKLVIGRYYYRCWTNDEDLELLFLTVFAISETDQAVVE